MDRKEEERADLERQRMRRLMVEGIIGQDDLKEDGYATSRERQRPRRGTLHGFKRVRVCPMCPFVRPYRYVRIYVHKPVRVYKACVEWSVPDAVEYD